MVTKEGTCWDQQWVLYVSDESLGSSLKSVLHGILTNLNLVFKKIKQIKKNLTHYQASIKKMSCWLSQKSQE